VGGRLSAPLRRTFSKGRALLRLRPRQWAELARAWWLMLHVRKRLLKQPFGEARVWFKERIAAPAHSKVRPSPHRILWAVSRAAWFLPGECTCLHRAVTAKILLAQHGWAAELHIGGRHGAKGRFEAHAWLECEGRVILGALPALDSYKRFEGFTL